MEFAHLSSTVEIKKIEETASKGMFHIEGLFAGYGVTLGNALRRALLSSLPGAAVTQIKIQGAPHEFTTIQGIKEDMVEVSLNFKKLRFRVHSDEPQVLRIEAKGEKIVTGKDIVVNSEVEVINPEVELCSLTAKNAEFVAELTVERGLGYWPVESRKHAEKLPVGAVAIDAIFSPVLRVNTEVENMRVGDRTDFNRLKIEIDTDGTVSPSQAIHKAANILKDHFDKLLSVPVEEFDAVVEKPSKKKTAK